jgi:hypothetical protein
MEFVFSCFSGKFLTGFDELPQFFYQVFKPVTDHPDSIDKDGIITSHFPADWALAY